MIEIDDIDKDLLDKHHFYLHMGYYRAQESRKEAREAGRKSRRWIHLSRVILERVTGRDLTYPADIADHINGDTHDNRRENLRVTTSSENARNRHRANKNNKLGYRGICFNGSSYVAQYCNEVIGYFKTLDEAVIAFKNASH